MEKKVRYPELEGQIAARGIKKVTIARRIGCTDRSLTNKLTGRTHFSWDEVDLMRRVFFPDVQHEVLMRTDSRA